MNETTLKYEENAARDREQFAEMIAMLQQNDARFQVERANGMLLIRLETKGGN